SLAYYVFRDSTYLIKSVLILSIFFLFNYTATTEIYTLSLHDALPISPFTLLKSIAPGSLSCSVARRNSRTDSFGSLSGNVASAVDRKSTRLNSSHLGISYAVFCLKKKKIYITAT